MGHVNPDPYTIVMQNDRLRARMNGKRMSRRDEEGHAHGYHRGTPEFGRGAAVVDPGGDPGDRGDPLDHPRGDPVGDRPDHHRMPRRARRDEHLGLTGPGAAPDRMEVNGHGDAEAHYRSQ